MPAGVDMSEPPATLTESILRGVTQAEGVIADLTYARPSVYFEVGYALGLGAHLLLTCRKDRQQGVQDASRVHFDLAQFKISFWEFDDPNSVLLWADGMEPPKRHKQIVPNRHAEPL
jgi:nucleoside 2-deoxyribosyltransferase